MNSDDECCIDLDSDSHGGHSSSGSAGPARKRPRGYTANVGGLDLVPAGLIAQSLQSNGVGTCSARPAESDVVRASPVLSGTRRRPARLVVRLDDSGTDTTVSDRSVGRRGGTGHRGKRWCFTYNNYAALEDFVSRLRGAAVTYVFQHETGSSGTPHLQGYVEFRSRLRLSAIVGLFGGLHRIHWSAARGTRDQNHDYCTKDDTRDAGTEPVLFGWPDVVRIITSLHPWQQEVVDLVTEIADERSIYWYWEAIGNVGKTALARYLIHHDRYNCLYVQGKGSDIKYLVSEHLKGAPANGSRLICIFDLSRTAEEYVPYGTMEQIKNGILMSGKYEASMHCFDFPHVIVFANYLPDTSKLSSDRWRIKEIL